MQMVVDQEAAVRRTLRSLWLTPLAGIPLMGAVALLSDTDSIGLYVFVGFILVTAAALGVMLLSVPKRLRKDFAPAEVRLTIADPEALYRRLERHLRAWWMIPVTDTRRWKSAYEFPVDPAPLKLPFEFSVEGPEVVLRGSKVHVEAARKVAGRWARREARRRSAQGNT